LKQIDAETPVQFASSCGSVELNTHRMVYQQGYGVINRIQGVREKAEARNERPASEN
jgi:hypothetical protein